MASDLPDHRALKSWEDAFAYPIPVVRRLEQQLQGDVGANRERLRTLVGASYRDLLRTAERIVGMSAQMRTVESTLGDVGQQCNARAVERIERNLAAWTEGRREESNSRYAFTSRLALLQACPLVISRLLRRGGSTLLAAKVLVVSRLVHKTLSKDGDAPPFVEDLWTQLVTLRARLLRRIDRLLASSGVTSTTIVEAMCAYSLATSSAATDVLRHFHHARLEAIKSAFESHDPKHENLARGLGLYTQTLQDTLAIMPSNLAESLARIKVQPLLHDPRVREVPELALDIHSRWLDHDIRNFTPWVRHDDLSKAETEKQLKVWTKKAFSATLHGLKSVLASVEDFKLLVQLRRQVLEQWFEGKRRITTYLTADSLGEIRSAITHQLIQLVHAKASRLHLVGTEIEATLQDWRPGISHHEDGIWSDSMASMDIGKGAHRFKTAVLDRSHGRDEPVLRALGSYRAWHAFVDEAMGAVKTMRNSTWDEDLDDDEDELLDSRNDLLSSEDPARIEEEVDKALATAFKKFEEKVDITVKAMVSTRPTAVYVLRILREIRLNLPDRQINIEQFGVATSNHVQKIVAEHVAKGPLESYGQNIKKQALAQKIPARALWEGSPSYPIQPSPHVYRLLHALMDSMLNAGSDIWSLSATKSVKMLMQRELLTVLSGIRIQKELNGIETDAEGNYAVERQVQLLFDTIFLRRALQCSEEGDDSDELSSLVADLDTDLGLDTASRERIGKSALDYWKKTHLLFGLLA